MNIHFSLFKDQEEGMLSYIEKDGVVIITMQQFHREILSIVYTFILVNYLIS